MLPKARPMLPRTVIAVSFALASTLGTAALAQGTAAAATSTDAASSADAAAADTRPAISVSTVGTATIEYNIFVSGTIGPVEKVLVQPQIQGQAIEELLADVGDHVEVGQLLARLSMAALNLQKSQLNAARAATEANVAQAQAATVAAQAAADQAVRVSDRTATLQQQGVTSSAAADQAKAAAESALAQLTSANEGLSAARAQLAVNDAQMANVDLQLRRTQVIATVAGVISERNATVGAIASAAAAPMFVIIKDGLLELRADVAEQDVVKLANGQAAEVSPVGAAQPLSGHVRLVEPKIDPMTRLGVVRIAIDDSSSVRDGLFAQARITVARHEDAVVVPVTSATTDPDGTFVLTVDANGQVHRTAVTAGIRDRDMLEITGGLKAGATIVARAAAFVRDGDMINPVPDTAAAAAPVSN